MKAIIYLIFLTTILTDEVKNSIHLSKDVNKGQIDVIASQTDKEYFKITISNQDILNQKYFFLWLESNDRNILMSIKDTKESSTKSSETVIDFPTSSGNILMIMSETLFEGRIDFFKETKELTFYLPTNMPELAYTVKCVLLSISEVPELSLGKIYTTRIDPAIKNFSLNLQFTPDPNLKLKRLRFQVTALKYKPDFQLNADVKNNGNMYQLNPIFHHTVGGMIQEEAHQICKETLCEYFLGIKSEKIKILNIETYLLPEIEQLSVHKLSEIYQRTYGNDETCVFELLFDPVMEDNDISVTLTSVAPKTGLYINARTQPLDIQKYTWKESGSVSKKITVRWAELIQMRAERSPLFIAVHTDFPGEYLLKVQIHEQATKGYLSQGLTEQGFVNDAEFIYYNYNFRVFDTQEIKFNVVLTIVTGDADLYLKQCSDECSSEPRIFEGSMQVRNQLMTKQISHTFKCINENNRYLNICYFIIGINGKQNHGTHFEITVNEGLYHRLLFQGHNMNLDLLPDQKQYFKLSINSKLNSKPQLSIDAIFGNFVLFASRQQQYPDETAYYKKNFESNKAGLYNAMQNIPLSDFNTPYDQEDGIFFFTIQAKTSVHINLKLIERTENEVVVHTLSANSQIRGQILNETEILYYTIKASIEKQQVQTATVTLSPLKGKFILFANRSGKLPQTNTAELISLDHHLELTFKDYEKRGDEYVIAIKLTEGQLPGDYQFYLSLRYSNKPTRLIPGIFNSFFLDQTNYFYIELLPEMDSILVLKSVIDGYGVSLCGRFSKYDSTPQSANCAFEIKDAQVGANLNKQQIKDACKTIDADRCLIYLQITGNTNLKYNLAFTYNNHPFKLVENIMFQGPSLGSLGKINLIYHIQHFQAIDLHFNSKGTKQTVYSKLIKQEDFLTEDSIKFPDASTNESSYQKVQGFITNIFYDKDTVNQFGDSPELLISIIGNENQFEYNHERNFILQTIGDAREISRTQIVSTQMDEDEQYYFTFYNNGNNPSIRIHVTAATLTKLTVTVSRGIQSRTPNTNKPLTDKSGISSVDITLLKSDVKLDANEKESLRGHYTISVKSSRSSQVNVYWNNLEGMNFSEITPHIPITMYIGPDKLFYFNFFIKETEIDIKNRAKIIIYLKSDVKVNMYLQTSNDGLSSPEQEGATWQTDISEAGGVAMIEIDPTHAQYCVNCYMTGMIEPGSEGRISLLADIEHHGIPLPLIAGYTFAYKLEKQQQRLYVINNQDNEPINLSISMLNGYVDVFISDSPDVSIQNNKSKHSLEKNFTIHKFIVISPKDLGITSAGSIYVLFVNQQQEVVSYTAIVDKNEIKNPIEPGITKFLHIPPTTEEVVYFTPRPNIDTVTIRLELRQVLDEQQIEQGLKMISEMIEMYHLNTDRDRYPLKYMKKEFSHNKVYVTYDIQTNKSGTFYINIHNTLQTGIFIALDMLTGSMKLVNLSELYIDATMNSHGNIYEAYSIPDKILYVSLNKCKGNVNISFYESNFENVIQNNATKFESYGSDSTRNSYIKTNSTRIFVKATPDEGQQAFYQISIFNEKDYTNISHTVIVEGDNARIKFITETSEVKFKPLILDSTYTNEFYHRVNYTLYLSDDFEVQKYTQYCSNFRIDSAFNNPHLLAFSYTELIKRIPKKEANEKSITLKVEGLRPNTKYYGGLVIIVDLVPAEEGFISPVKTGQTLYDSFTFVTPRMMIPVNLIISILVSLAILACLFCIIKAYLFGQVGNFRGLEKLGKLAEFDDTLFGYNVVSILEKESPPESEKVHKRQVKKETEEDIESGDSSVEIEMNENKNKKKPLNVQINL